MFYIQVMLKDSLEEVKEGGEVYYSNIIRREITSLKYFDYENFGEGIILYVINKGNLDKFLKRLYEVQEEQELLSLDKGKETSTLKQLRELISYLEDIYKDTYFSWEIYAITAKVPYDEEIIKL